ncbi:MULTISPECIES: hypothetical protein [unclassified Aeromicrobium]|jgi:hypothetical protein|uniref:hypothetical protein n=1 Tax=unclassified Aeromicrobium TaxID=2633570 RepID=UPI000AFAECEB|nr:MULTISPECIES: hypothetical protein [unclassified Aeromicrobium]
MGFFSELFKQPPPSVTFTPVRGEQLFVGESFYQSALVGLLKARGHAPASLKNCRLPINESFVAHLTPEARNPHDPNAVAVVVDNHVVAYLSRANAAEYRRTLGTKSGEATVALWVKPGGKGIVSVWPQE